MLFDNYAIHVAALSLVLSCVTIFTTLWLWRRTHRPILVAYIDESDCKAGMSLFDLVVANVGNRPAINIRLTAKKEDILALAGESADQSFDQLRLQCFDPESAIAVLKPAEELSTPFGTYSSDINKRRINYGHTVPIVIKYDGPDGDRYQSSVRLKVFCRNGFSGAAWGHKVNSK